ncbi:uncharacterized protein LOC112514776 [Cynara cardunculus var. scolymus]|uniref:uncharacterized protein LOC112514776 n=1 Tax=Cynara cardunculus var. scolymus TaxID=59895 RepID=UPI000D624845|nr:uncharacterized protein LOC112514776 [Cynara cardunculus var. scolymus]
MGKDQTNHSKQQRISLNKQITLRSVASLDEYCQRLKDLAEQLRNVECPVTDQRMVLQLVRGLPLEFDTTVAYINQTLPNWDTTCTPGTGLTTSVNPPKDTPHRKLSRGRGSNSNRNQSNSRNNQPSTGQSNSRERPNSAGQPSNPAAYPPAPHPLWTMPPPPCPYPTQQGWAYSWYPGPIPTLSQQQQRRAPQQHSYEAHSLQTNSSQAHTTGSYNALDPTDIGTAFQALTMDPLDDSQ